MNPAWMEEIIGSGRFCTAAPLLKGWSRDEKYILTDRDGQKFLLRLSAESLLEKKHKQFELLQKVQSLNILASEPVDFGQLRDGRVYTLLSYLPGEDAETYVKRLSPKAAYRLGIQAGETMKKLHQIPVEPPETPWETVFRNKIPRKAAALRACPIDLPEKEETIAYVMAHAHRTNGRPTGFTHGDFHVGNLIVHKGRIGVIDFDRNALADPYDEFKPFCWNVYASPPFETGLIDGYFNGNVPDDFFPLLALYAAENRISHLPWAVSYGEKEVETALRVSQDILLWFDHFRREVPTWYEKSFGQNTAPTVLSILIGV